MSDLATIETEVRRARRNLAHPHARLVEERGGYTVRTSGDRRRRPLCAIGSAAFAELARAGALAPAGEGVWRLAAGAPRLDDRPALAERPGVTEGEKPVAETDGAVVMRRANVTESPLAWLARRKDAAGRPFLEPAEAAAGERLREDGVRAGQLGRMTMDWTAGPRDATPRGPGADPLAGNRAARARVEGALAAAGPGLREIVERVCLAEASLEAAERALGHPRRAGKLLLKLGLQRVAAFYGIG